MHCLKCGREVQEGQAFCPDCLQVIAQQPALPDGAVILPPRQNSTSRRSPVKKRVLSTEEKLALTRQQLHKSRVLSFVLFLMVILLVGVCVFLILKPNQPAVGRNYQTPSTTMATIAPNSE